MEIGNSGDRKHIEIKTKIHFDFPIYHSYIGMVDICTVWFYCLVYCCSTESTNDHFSEFSWQKVDLVNPV